MNKTTRSEQSKENAQYFEQKSSTSSSKSKSTSTSSSTKKRKDNNEKSSELTKENPTRHEHKVLASKSKDFQQKESNEIDENELDNPTKKIKKTYGLRKRESIQYPRLKPIILDNVDLSKLQSNIIDRDKVIQVANRNRTIRSSNSLSENKMVFTSVKSEKHISLSQSETSEVSEYVST